MMLQTIKVKDVTIGQGMPKICVPLVGKTIEELQNEALNLSTLKIDLVEWRVDFFEQMGELERVKEALSEIRDILKDTPLIFTCRSAKEGGEKDITSKYYVEMNKAILETEQVDIIDVELFQDADDVKELIHVAHSHRLTVIVSNHDFKKTPTKGDILSRLRKAQSLGADLPKIAVMPNEIKDVITLLDATNEMKEKYADRPFITMSMAGKGVISRLSGEIFGSAITFGTITKASAPGQVNIEELRSVLELIHANL